MSPPYKAVAIGASAGCVEALSRVLPALPKEYPLPIMVVVHLPPHKESVMAELLATKCQMVVCEANDKEPILPGHIYIAPADYHLLVEHDGFLSLSNEEEVLFSRPSIDVLFESFADVYREAAIGVVLTGANSDGALGMAQISKQGGLCLVQDPSSAYAAAMPEAAAHLSPGAKILSLDAIKDALLSIGAEVSQYLKEEAPKPLRIMIVDDDLASAQTVCWMLETLGYDSVMAHDGKSAIALARAEKPQIVFLDITLPDMNGFEICRILKTDPHLRDIHIAAQTGWSDEGTRQKALGEGFDDFLVKPVSMERYAGILKNFTDKVKA